MNRLAGGTSESRARLLLSASRHPLANVVVGGLRDAAVDADTPLVVAVSGGADSMAMLVLLAAVRERTDPRLESLAVASIDHGIRPESRAEAEAAIALAGRIGISRASVVRVTVSRDGNLLDAARHARLDGLRSAARDFGSRHIALAHHAEDRAESLLLALSRGGGLDALTGLRARRELDDGVVLVRPLLRARRAHLRELLVQAGVCWHEDPSNALRARGSLRGDPSTAALIDRLAAGASTALDEAERLSDLRDSLVAAALPAGSTALSRAGFDALPAAIRPAALARLARAAGVQLPRSVVEQCVVVAPGDRDPRTFDCGGGRVLSITARAVTVD